MLRPARQEDAEAIAALYAVHVLTGTGTFELDPPDAAEMGGRLAKVVERGWPWLVLEEGGRIVGYAYATQFRERAAYRRCGETSVYVAEGEGGRGHGRRLLEALVVAAPAAGFRTLVAVIGDRGNEASIRLHAACGFRMAGSFSRVGEKFGRLLDIVLMQRDLG
jgi:phosphinothricin acetyltransferase